MSDLPVSLARMLRVAAEILEALSETMDVPESLRKAKESEFRDAVDHLTAAWNGASKDSLAAGQSAIQQTLALFRNAMLQHPDKVDMLRRLMEEMGKAQATLPARPASKPAAPAAKAHPTQARSPFADSHIQWTPGATDVPLRPQLSYAADPNPSHWDVVTQDIPEALRNGVLHRDSHCCGFCGFRSQKYQEILARGGQWWNMSALTTACIFCGQVLTLERVAVMRSGVLIHAAGISQVDLNALAVLIYVCRITQGPAAQPARSLLDKIMLRRKPARGHLGYDDPKRLADDLRDCRAENALIQLLERCRDIRLFPLDRRIVKEADFEFNTYPQIQAYWRSSQGPFGSAPIADLDVGILRTQALRGLRSPVRFHRPAPVTHALAAHR